MKLCFAGMRKRLLTNIIELPFSWEKNRKYRHIFRLLALHIGKDIEISSSDNVDTIHTDIRTSDMFADMIR